MSRPAVLIVQRHLAPLSVFLEPSYDVFRLWEGPPIEARDAVRALIVAGEFPLDIPLVEGLPKLELIACFTSGHDGIDVRWCHTRGLKVSHAPGVNHEDVADHAMGLILGSARNIVSGDRSLRAGGWTPDAKSLSASLRGKRIGIVGLGAIGRAIARRADVFGLEVAWWAPRDKTTDWLRAESLVELARRSDILVVACRADETNRGLISAEVIAALGSDGLLVNVARGQLVDEDALIGALKSGTLGAAALDVFAEEPTDPARWADVPNTVLTPHTAGATDQAVQAMLRLLLENLEAHFAGRTLVTEAR